MKINEKIALESVQETLLLPLWGRAIETKKKKPLLEDDIALSIISNQSYNFTLIAKNISYLTQQSWISRSIFFDKKIKEFINENPLATIINIGCGLDTTYDRVDNGKIQWIDLDLPEVIKLRRKYISESARRKFVSMSILDTDWYKEINNFNKIMLLIAGVLYYFNETEVKKLFGDFHKFIPGVEIVFDYCSKKGLQIANKKVIKKSGMNKFAYLQWGIDNIFDIENWDKNIKVLTNMPIFKDYKKNFPIVKRIGMNISDNMKIMSLANIKIN